MTISLKTLRDLQIYKQFAVSQLNSEMSIKEVLTNLGFIQLDSMSVVARSQELVCWARLKNYQLGDLLELYHQDQAVELYSFALTLHLKDNELVPLFQGKAYEALMASSTVAESQTLLAELAEVQPILKRAFIKNKQQGTWQQSPKDRLIDKLWRAGLIEVQRDEKFNKRLHLGKGIRSELSPQVLEYQMYQQLILMTFNNLGIITEGEASHYFNLKKGLTKVILAEMLTAGDIQKIGVENYGEHYLLVSDQELVTNLAEFPTLSPKLLSPFDNLIRDRERTAKLFGIDFKLESYIKAENRRYGYFAMPILIAGELIGTVDLKNERQLGQLIIKGFVFFKPENQERYTAEILGVLTELKDFLNLTELIYQEQIFTGFT